MKSIEIIKKLGINAKEAAVELANVNNKQKNEALNNLKQDLEKISAIIKDNDFVDLTKIRIYLQNGQIWRQVDSTPYRGPKNLEGKKAFISSASLGSFLMKIEGIGGKFRVRREK